MQRFLKKLLGKDVLAVIKNVSALFYSRSRFFFTTFYLAILKKLKNFQTRKSLDKRLFIPIIIFQPGKVGSITVQHSLEKAFQELNLNTPIYHAHILERIDERIEFIRLVRKNPEKSIKKLLESKSLRFEMDTQPDQPWNIISLVRDPVAIKVSAMFQVLEEYIPDWQERYKYKILNLSDLMKMLLTKDEFQPESLDEWYERQILDFLKIDVFSIPFDFQKGYQIYTNRKEIRFLIIRLEDLNRAGSQAMREFLGIKEFKIVTSNSGEEKPYRGLYQEFKSLPLPESYIERAYNTRFANYFYSPQEITLYRRRWLGQHDRNLEHDL